MQSYTLTGFTTKGNARLRNEDSILINSELLKDEKKYFKKLNLDENIYIKLAIADVSDGALNSAVFLKENSFNSPPPIEFIVESNMVNIFNSDSEHSIP